MEYYLLHISEVFFWILTTFKETCTIGSVKVTSRPQPPEKPLSYTHLYLLSFRAPKCHPSSSLYPLQPATRHPARFSVYMLYITAPTDLIFCPPTAPSMMSLRQRHIDPQLAMGSQRLVESCHGQEGEGSSYRSRAALRQTLSHSFGQSEALGMPPLSSAVSHPAIFSASSSHIPHSSFYAAASHSSHYHSTHFQPMDTIPDLPYETSPQRTRRSGSFGYRLARAWDWVQKHSTLLSQTLHTFESYYLLGLIFVAVIGCTYW